MMALKTTKRHRLQPKTTTKKKPSSVQQTNTVKTFTQHVQELRSRLFWVAIVAVATGAAVYAYQDFFLKLIMQPLGQQKLIYLTPGGGFAFIFTVTLYVTLIFIFPFILYQLYSFIRPAIPAHANKLSGRIALAAFLLMAVGVAFGYLYAVPSGLKFLTNFANDYVTPSLTADSYLNFVIAYVFGIGALFELPLLLLFWHWIHPLTPGKLLSSERYIIVVAFVLAAIISPTPDAFNQTVIAVPIIIIYQLGVVAVLVSIRKARKVKNHQDELETIEYIPPIKNTNLIKPVTLAPAVVVAANRPVRPRLASSSVDGMVKQTRKPTAVESTRRPKPSGRGPSVPRRPRLMDDFVTVRRSAIDTTR